ncbi:PAS domain-containing protein [Algoriphagus sp. H41]|uniref:histidine kinase n=1 Tax=Algoriphagus oliviformis TaxID=2811231 RepID=A0ABS3C4B3_9BACT|nr:PAS domain-containing protein [Algoriphagus oliviformis]MBN7811958.1 PAS domain-containing protein [Algoriphagus oliviformis]
MSTTESTTNLASPSSPNAYKDILLEHLETMTNSGVWEMDLETKKLTFSDGIFKMLGYQPGELELKPEQAKLLVHADDLERVRADFYRFLESGSQLDITHRLLTKEGKAIWVMSKAKLIGELNGTKKVVGALQNIDESVRTKERLRSEREKNRALIENLDGIFWEADAQTFEFTYISPQAEKITGYTPREWMEERGFWQAHIHPDDRDRAIQTCHFETQRLQDHNFDYRFLAKDGKVIWLNDRVNVVAEDGKPKTLRGMMVNITREREIAQALQEEIGLNQSLIQQLPSVFFLFDMDRKFLLWNHQLESMSEYSSEEISSMSPEEFFTGSDKGIFDDYAQKVLQGTQIDFDLKLRTKSGKRIPFLFSASALTYHDKTCIFGTGQDISELMESRRSTAQHIERFQIVTRATSDAIWDFEIEKNKLYWGEGFLTLFGYDPKTTDVHFEFLLSLIHPDDRERIFRLIQSYLDPSSSKSHWLEEYRFLKSDGNYAFVLDKAIFIRNEKGAVTRVVGAMQDISGQKETEKSLQTLNQKLEKNVRDLAISNQELQQFAFVASHDLQEPLRMISSFMGLLERKYSHVLDERAMEYISFATNGAKQMRRVILDLLELSRVGKVGETKAEVDVDELIEELKSYMKKTLKEKNALISYENLPKVYSYKTPLFQIFQNLIGNGIKYSKPDKAPSINVRGRELPEAWEFSVEDNGIGIKEEYFNKVFVLFQRLHNQREYDGTGIGLAIVKKSVEFLGGEISLQSEIGVGSRFTFTIRK